MLFAQDGAPKGARVDRFLKEVEGSASGPTDVRSSHNGEVTDLDHADKVGQARRLFLCSAAIQIFANSPPDVDAKDACECARRLLEEMQDRRWMP